MQIHLTKFIIVNQQYPKLAQYIIRCINRKIKIRHMFD